jgi:hypothetical protein
MSQSVSSLIVEKRQTGTFAVPVPSITRPRAPASTIAVSSTGSIPG